MPDKQQHGGDPEKAKDLAEWSLEELEDGDARKAEKLAEEALKADEAAARRVLEGELGDEEEDEGR